MTDEVAATSGIVGMSGIAGHGAMRHTVALVDATPHRAPLARLFGVTPLPGAARGPYREALGELEVAAALDHLGDGWRVIHSLPLGEDGGVVDHLVIGPAGVFVVDTSAHPGADVIVDQRAFTASDVRLPSIRAMEHDMGRVERILSSASGDAVEVAGVLVVVETKSLTVREKHRDVAVLHATDVAGWLARRPRVLADDRIAAISAVAERPETWDSEPTETDIQVLRERFDAVRRQVQFAARVQRLWIAGVSIAVVGAFLIVTYAMLVGSLDRR